MHKRPGTGLLLCLAIAGCTVGPDYTRPDLPLPETFLERPATATVTGSVWAAFEEPELAALIAAARRHNTDIASAVATLNESRALAGLQVFSLFPTITATASQERTSQSGDDPFAFPEQGIAERYRAGFDATWEIDLFGTLRRSSELIRRRVEADTQAVYAVELSVVAETAQAYFQWRGQSLRIRLLERNLASQADSVTILESALEAGRGTALEVAQARAEERRLAATLPGARAERTAALQRLAVLTGQLPGEVRAALAEPKAMPPMPAYVPVGTPVEWLARRPDVAQAERRLAEFTSGIGVQTAELYPRLNLIGEFGWTGRDSGAIGDSSAERWQFAPTLSWRFLDIGRVMRRIDEAEAQAAGVAAAFEASWRLAIEETENALANFRAAGESVLALREAVAEAETAVRLARLRYDNGADSFFTVLDAERTSLGLQDQYALAEIDHATALAALYKALGGDFAE